MRFEPFSKLMSENTKNGIYKSKDFMGTGTPIVKMSQLFGNRFIDSYLDGYEQIILDDKELEGYRLLENDLLFSRTSVVPEGVGMCSIIREKERDLVFESNIIRVRLNNDLVNPEFVFRYFQSPQGRGSVLSIAGGTNIKTIKASSLKDLKVPLLDRDAQNNVVEMLRNYDNLIENNRRRIQLLEESARLLYQEWFVHLRFPGHEQVKITDGVPEGWDRLSVTECCEKSTYGYTASASQDAIGPKFLRITDIVPSSISWADVPYCEADEATTKKYQLKEGDIVVARTGATVGYAKRMPSLSEPVIYASYLVKFSPNKSVVDDLLLGVFMESEQYKDFVRGNAGGAAQPNANAQILGGAKLLVPSELLQKEFRSNVAPLIEQKFLLEKQNASLAKARDLLLPKLMSGELTV